MKPEHQFKRIEEAEAWLQSQGFWLVNGTCNWINDANAAAGVYSIDGTWGEVKGWRVEINRHAAAENGEQKVPPRSERERPLHALPEISQTDDGKFEIGLDGPTFESRDFAEDVAAARQADASAPRTIATPDDIRGMRWWNALTEIDRLFWLQKADSARPADAWTAFKQEIAKEGKA